MPLAPTIAGAAPLYTPKETFSPFDGVTVTGEFGPTSGGVLHDSNTNVLYVQQTGWDYTVTNTSLTFFLSNRTTGASFQQVMANVFMQRPVASDPTLQVGYNVPAYRDFGVNNRVLTGVTDDTAGTALYSARNTQDGNVFLYNVEGSGETDTKYVADANQPIPIRATANTVLVCNPDTNGNTWGSFNRTTGAIAVMPNDESKKPFPTPSPCVLFSVGAKDYAYTSTGNSVYFNNISDNSQTSGPSGSVSPSTSAAPGTVVSLLYVNDGVNDPYVFVGYATTEYVAKINVQTFDITAKASGTNQTARGYFLSTTQVPGVITDTGVYRLNADQTWTLEENTSADLTGLTDIVELPPDTTGSTVVRYAMAFQGVQLAIGFRGGPWQTLQVFPQLSSGGINGVSNSEYGFCNANKVVGYGQTTSVTRKIETETDILLIPSVNGPNAVAVSKFPSPTFQDMSSQTWGFLPTKINASGSCSGPRVDGWTLRTDNGSVEYTRTAVTATDPRPLITTTSAARVTTSQELGLTQRETNITPTAGNYCFNGARLIYLGNAEGVWQYNMIVGTFKKMADLPTQGELRELHPLTDAIVLAVIRLSARDVVYMWKSGTWSEVKYSSSNNFVQVLAINIEQVMILDQTNGNLSVFNTSTGINTPIISGVGATTDIILLPKRDGYLFCTSDYATIYILDTSFTFRTVVGSGETPTKGLTAAAYTPTATNSVYAFNATNMLQLAIDTGVWSVAGTIDETNFSKVLPVETNKWLVDNPVRMLTLNTTSNEAVTTGFTTSTVTEVFTNGLGNDVVGTGITAFAVYGGTASLTQDFVTATPTAGPTVRPATGNHLAVEILIGIEIVLLVMLIAFYLIRLFYYRQSLRSLFLPPKNE